MKSICFLPYSGGTRFDELNEKIKKKLSEITKVESFLLNKIEDYFPENYAIESFPELIFVPTIFDNENSMSYGGVDFAIRWYFHVISLNTKLNFKIVLLGIEEKSSFYQNCDYSYFLKCPNVQYIQNSFQDIKLIIESEIKEFDRNEALGKIDLIGIKPPASYKSHHSISNEWSILRWSTALNISAELDSELQKNKNNIKASLFYKYLSIKYPIASNKTVNKKALKNDGSILLIDDEVEKGWGVIFQEICKGKNYTSLGKDFKKINDKDKIVDVAFEIAKDADVIILDLRLHDSDFEERDPKKLTGYKLLEKIKEHNKGIQVIIFSASNKIWNLQELQNVGIDGFILKESPENSVDEEFTKQLIENIYKTIDTCLGYSFLKKNVETFKNLSQQLELRKKKKELPKEFVDEYLRWLEFGVLNILKYKSNEGNVMSFSIFFTVLENIANRLIDIDTPISTGTYNEYKFEFRRSRTFLKYYKLISNNYVNSGSDLLIIGRMGWTQKVINTLDALSCNLVDVTPLIDKRNDIIHSNSTTGNGIDITTQDLQDIFSIVTKNIEKIP
jgi:DNA-binding NarL/FixJ family response regulator